MSIILLRIQVVMLCFVDWLRILGIYLFSE